MIQGTYYLSVARKNEFSGISAEQRGTYNRVLIRAGTPKELLASLSDYQKKFILENLEKNAVYETSNSYIKEPVSTRSKLMSDMCLSFICYSFETNGEKQYQIFPSFQWLGNSYTIEHDAFELSLHPADFEPIYPNLNDSPVKMAVYFTRPNGKQISIGSIEQYPEMLDPKQPIADFQMPDGCNKKSDGYYGGCAVYYAKKIGNDTSTPLLIKYMHQSNTLFHSDVTSYSYSFLLETK